MMIMMIVKKKTITKQLIRIKYNLYDFLYIYKIFYNIHNLTCINFYNNFDKLI
jgi:hypothetical protein